VDYLREVNANCFVVNGGGIIDLLRHDLVTANPNRVRLSVVRCFGTVGVLS
jgi:hypothetical protein